MTTAIEVTGRKRTGTLRGRRMWCAGFALTLGGAAIAQGTANPAGELTAPAAAARIGVDVLKGTWVRPDGGYTIEIKSIDPNGRIDATYFNPKLLPFAKARALPEGATLRVFFELQAGGYAGSTYELSYDAASDRLKGIYYQAVVKQKFDVVFVRK